MNELNNLWIYDIGAVFAVVFLIASLVWLKIHRSQQNLFQYRTLRVRSLKEPNREIHRNKKVLKDKVVKGRILASIARAERQRRKNYYNYLNRYSGYF